jgi:hypothetical protein
MQREPDTFFRLADPYEELSSADEFWKRVGGKDHVVIENFLYRPDVLGSLEPPKKWIIRNKTFRNFSFAKTHLSQLEFTNCLFENCILIGSIFTDCRFHGCNFVNCNVYRSQIQSCYIDPKAFTRCLDRKKYANIGVGLYQELLHNSQQQAQPEFTRDAQYQFSRWKRYLGWDEIKSSEDGRFKKVRKSVVLFQSWLFEKIAGSGVRLGNLAATSVCMLAAFTFLNFYFRSAFGLMLREECVQTLAEAFYFSTIVVTSLGFGDITPTTDLGRVIVSLEAIVGFLTFALLVSMTFRRITN